MALPSNVGHGTVTGRFIDSSGTAIEGKVRFTPTPKRLLNATANMAVTTWTWTQTGGPAVTLTGTGATRTFTAPANENGATLTFTASADGSPADTVTIDVLPHDLWQLRSGVLVPVQMLTTADF